MNKVTSVTSKWLEYGPRLIGSLSIISFLTLLRRRGLFKRILSDTNRSFSEAWGHCLPSITPQKITGVNKPAKLVLDRRRMALGIKELLPLLELVHLSNAERILEIGTSSGGTTWHLAANIGSEGRVITVDLPPKTSTQGRYSPTQLATERPTESRLGRYFQGTLEANRIEQLLTDSAKLSLPMIGEKVDIIFIDGAHTYEYVKNDTEIAMRLLKPGGYIVWHDYFVYHPDYGVRRYLHGLSKSIPVYRLCESLSAIAHLP